MEAIEVVDVHGLAPGGSVLVDASAFGYPVASLANLPAGDYVVQAVLHRYETFHVAGGHTLLLPADRGEGQQWNRAPGNLLSLPTCLRLVSADGARVDLALTEVMPPIAPPADTPYVRHITVESPRLSAFWGRPIRLGAHVILPHGFEEHPEARFPLITGRPSVRSSRVSSTSTSARWTTGIWRVPCAASRGAATATAAAGFVRLVTALTTARSGRGLDVEGPPV